MKEMERMGTWNDGRGASDDQTALPLSQLLSALPDIDMHSELPTKSYVQANSPPPYTLANSFSSSSPL